MKFSIIGFVVLIILWMYAACVVACVAACDAADNADDKAERWFYDKRP